MAIYQAAYGEDRDEDLPRDMYRAAKWALWHALSEEKQIWVEKAKAQRGAIAGDLTKAKPPMLTEK